MRRPVWKSAVGLVVVLLVTPLTVVLGTLLQRQLYIPLSIAIVVLSMIPFFVSFERRGPQVRELVTLAVMVALSVAARAVFAVVPQFKPMAAVVMMSGIALGPSSGFLVGSLSAFLSNLIFGQGPWTPWQMLAFGLCGYAFGVLARAGIVPREGWAMRDRLLASVLGGMFVLCVAGPILDSSSLFWMASSITPQTMAAIYLAGVPFNAVHALATFATILVVGDPVLDRIARLRHKYGMFE